MNTTDGCRDTICRIASARHLSQFATNPAVLPGGLMSVAGHPDFTIVVSFQRWSSAIRRRGLNHWIAWESPNNTTLVAPDPLPNTQVFTSCDSPDVTHSWRGIAAMSATAAVIRVIF